MAFYNNNRYHVDDCRNLRFVHSFGLPCCADKLLQFCDITFDDEFVIINVIEPNAGKNPRTILNTYKLPFDRILAVDIINHQNITEKNKSVIGRGLAGGLLFGPAGMFLGGLSGTGVKRSTKITYFLSFSYENKENEINNILFDIQGAVKPCGSFIMDLRSRLPKIETEEPEINEQGEILL